MLKQYVLVFDETLVSRDDITSFLNTDSNIKNWLAFMSNSVIVTTDQDAHYLSNILHGKFESMNMFITEVVHGNNNGWLNKDSWDFINNPQSA
ncbi:TPA: hypothetical protein ACX6SR_001915 [Photobacterium damselae]|uniref:Uncharacterized protein n=1 Tax=Photobacterium damselae subsp. damselae TaxID=85581 RepID=A0A850QQT3_PHODD|nr:hypothetical protein [Photobacterium damselae subsp. damselae]